MNLAESFRMSLRSLSANKLRSLLTMLGIIIGTGAVIALLSLGEGARLAITSQIQSIGSNLIFVFAGRMDQSGASAARPVQPLTRTDAAAMADPAFSSDIAGVAPEVNRTTQVTFGREELMVNTIGATAAYEFVRNYEVELGAFFTDGEEAAASRVAILGSQTATTLFGYPDLALGETIRINRVTFTVIGVLKAKGGQGFGGGSQDQVVLVPLSTLQQRLFADRYQGSAGRRVDMISVSAADEGSIESVIEQITLLMRERHAIQYGEDDFTVTSQEEILGMFNQITQVLTIFLGAIAGISLLVGGIGIMNIMLVSVTERTREIGVRKAVGARKSDILWQFLIESMVLSLSGGAIGIGFGWAVSAAVNATGQFTTFVSMDAVVLAVSFSIGVGVFFGIYPASRAANLHPIDALRYE